MVVLKKLKINIVCGILDIVASFLYFFFFFFIGTFSGAIGASDGTEVLSQVLLIFAILFIVLHFISFFQSKKVHIRLLGTIFGLVGHGIYLVSGAYLGWLAMIFTIVASVFLLRDNHYFVLDAVEVRK